MEFHSSVLFVEDIEKSKEFYVGLLGMEILNDFGKNVVFVGGVTIWELGFGHVINRKLETEGESNRFELYFESELIDDIFEKLKRKNVEFLHEIHEEAWGQRTIRFFDPDKHLIEVGEPLPTFVKNMSRQGLTMGEIFNKSGIPIETLKKILK